tara:strand:+ start:5461 stop:6324 length:864 start_codon:yes stop_codon:yes gene_type:complete
MGLFGGDDEEKPDPGAPLGAWGSQALKRDEFFGERGNQFRGSPLGMGRLVRSSMAPQYRPSMTGVDPVAKMKQQKKTLREMEQTAKKRSEGKSSMEWGNDAALAADLTMGVTLAKTKEERDSAIKRAAMVGSMKALQHGVTAAIDYFDKDTAKEAVKAAATDETARIVKNAGAMSKDASLLSDPAGVTEGAMSAIGLGADIVGGDNPVAATIEAGAETAGGMAGATAGTAVLPGIGTVAGAMLGSKVGKEAGQKLSEIAKLRKKRMQQGGGAVQNPAMYGGVSDYLA